MKDEGRAKAAQSQVQARYKPGDWEVQARYMRGTCEVHACYMRVTCVVQARFGTGTRVGSGTHGSDAAGRDLARERWFRRYYARGFAPGGFKRGLKLPASLR
jgi:hypothetical protein